MRLIWTFICLVLFTALPLMTTGCGGINASQTVSPATFFLPGLMKTEPPASQCTNLVAVVQ